MPSSRRIASVWLIGLLSAATALLAPRALSAQAAPIASRSADMSIFAGYSSVTPAYVSGRESASSFGLNLTRYLRFPIEPSLEGRVNLASGPLVNERTYLFGLRAQADLRTHFHPYADLLTGIGDIHYNHNTGYLGDNSTVYSYGGGVDIDLIHHFQAKVDFQAQHWNLGHNNTFQPTLLMVGLAYRIPFSKHIRQRDLVHP